MYGGRLLGQGAYGCVFTPKLLCKTPLQSIKQQGVDYSVGKVTTPAEAKKEIIVSTLLRDFPNIQNYFILPVPDCIPEPESKQKDKDITQCEVIDKKDKDLKSLIQLKMPLGGKALADIQKNTTNIHYYKFGQQLLEAAVILCTHGIIYNDLHGYNVLMTHPAKPQIIDFGWCGFINLTKSEDDMTFTSFQPDKQYDQQPPEFVVMNGLMHNKMSSGKKYSIDEIIDATITKKHSIKDVIVPLFQKTLQECKNYLRNFYNHSKSLQAQEFYNFYKMYWHKFDAWSVGVLLTKVYRDMMFDKSFVEGPDYRSHNTMYRQVLEGLTMIDPSKRFDTIQALKLWNPNSSILKHPKVQSWL